MARRRLDVREAAEHLGITVDAVRKRIQRGTLEAEKEDGTVYVWPDTDQPQAQVEGSALVEELRDRVRFLEDQLRREQDAHSEARRLVAARCSGSRSWRPLRSPQKTDRAPARGRRRGEKNPARLREALRGPLDAYADGSVLLGRFGYRGDVSLIFQASRA